MFTYHEYKNNSEHWLKYATMLHLIICYKGTNYTCIIIIYDLNILTIIIKLYHNT